MYTEAPKPGQLYTSDVTYLQVEYSAFAKNTAGSTPSFPRSGTP